MRTKFILSILVAGAMLICINAKAGTGETKFGVTAGLNMANIAGSDATDNSMKIGMNIGAVGDFGLSDNFSVNASLLYSMMGDQSSANSSAKFNANYITIPIVAKYKFGGGANIFAGPYVGILMSGKVTDGTNTLDVKSDMNSTDFGLHIGVGYDLPAGLGFNARYGLGLANIDKSVAGVQPKVTNTLIAINVTYMFGGK